MVQKGVARGYSQEMGHQSFANRFARLERMIRANRPTKFLKELRVKFVNSSKDKCFGIIFVSDNNFVSDGIWGRMQRGSDGFVWIFIGHFLRGGTLTRGKDIRVTPGDDGTVTLCTLRAATVLSRGCRADFGRPLTKKVMSHLRDGPGVMAPLRTNIVPLTRVWNTPPSVTPPLRSPRFQRSLPFQPCQGTVRKP